MTEIAADDRRDYYRIGDTVGLTYSICNSENDLPTPDEFVSESPDEFQLINHLSQIDLENSALLHNIQDVNPDVGRYLKIINTKIEAIARHAIAVGLTDELKSQKVTLSAGGLSITADQQLPLETYIRSQMILYPSCSGILTYSKVVRSEPIANTEPQQFDIALKYVLINETDRDVLVRHVLQLQSNLLRQSK